MQYTHPNLEAAMHSEFKEPFEEDVIIDICNNNEDVFKLVELIVTTEKLKVDSMIEMGKLIKLIKSKYDSELTSKVNEALCDNDLEIQLRNSDYE